MVIWERHLQIRRSFKTIAHTRHTCLEAMMPNTVHAANADSSEECDKHPASEDTDKSPVIFLSLPLELRERIYHYLLPPILTSLNPLPPFLGLNLTADLTYSILHVNKAIRVDAGIYYLQSRCFEIHSANQQTYFERYLASIPNAQGYEAVHRLSFPRFSGQMVDREGCSRYIELIEKCLGVVQLTLTFRLRDLLRKPWPELWCMSKQSTLMNTGDLSLATRHAIVQRYRLDRLIRLERLRGVVLVAQHERFLTGDPPQSVRDVAPNRLMGEVCAWLQSACLQYGNIVEVVLKRRM